MPNKKNQRMAWDISNAIACLKEVRDREQDDSERAETIRHGMDYAIEVVKGINSLSAPEPISPEQEIAEMLKAAAKGIANTLRDVADRLDDFGDPRFPSYDA